MGESVRDVRGGVALVGVKVQKPSASQGGGGGTGGPRVVGGDWEQSRG